MNSEPPSHSIPGIYCDLNARGLSGESDDNCYHGLARGRLIALRLSVFQPRVGNCACRGSAAAQPSTLKRLHHGSQSPRYKPFRVVILSGSTPRVAPAAQPWAERFERRRRSRNKTKKNVTREKHSSPNILPVGCSMLNVSDKNYGHRP